MHFLLSFFILCNSLSAFYQLINMVQCFKHYYHYLRLYEHEILKLYAFLGYSLGQQQMAEMFSFRRLYALTPCQLKTK